MVKIRLARGGAKKKPYYRIVVADVRKKRDGKFIERIGFYNPMIQENRFEIDSDRAKYWLSTGAQPTDRVRKLMKQAEIEGA
ncbi:MAG: 30S ribosomal protein S16 [SAR324 cluster bacterium]|nr:30S ribosomal protein S16 [SAR324 cluster bacterium]